ncbi:glycoside hydrolase [Penicillium longicatenatum]|nr:glycoside hydrolase [Penicillium longicatenatum]
MHSFLGAAASILAFGGFAGHAVATRVGRPALCPDSCASYNPVDWFTFRNVPQVTRCNETMLLEFNIFNDLDDPQVHSTLHVCASGVLDKLQNSSSVKTASSSVSTKKSITYQIGAWGSSPSESGESNYSELLDALQTYLTGHPQKPEIFGYSNGVAAGVYLGGSVQQVSNVEFAIDKLRSFLSDTTYSTAAIQYCGSSSNETIGVAVDLNGDIPTVQQYVQSWHGGECLSGFDKSATGSTSLTFLGTHKANGTQSTHSRVSRGSHGSHGHYVSHSHQRRDDTCTYREVVSGDTCYGLITDCGITSDEFYEYNTATDLCTALVPGEYVCCSSGSLPDFSPSAYSNGTCYTYSVQSGDSCSDLASTYSLTEAEIETYNNETWAWYGCSELQAGQNICLSTGNPPYPLPIANAECGPQVAGTVFNSTDSGDWESYNPCPLNACCDAFGQCGITPVYCNRTFADNNNPGTAANGTNGCLSNCGTTITNWAVPPSSFYKVGYYEPTSMDRSCLQMSPLSIDTSVLTHVYYAFGNISSDFSINVNGYETEFSEFMELKDVKRVMSFGGWDFSTGVDTYMIFREGTTAAYRSTLVENIVNYVSDTGLDGIDIDWEYPGEPDIAGIPAGSDDEGENYLAFLKALKAALPDDIILSITAPASYWYLQAFPISDMADVVDFINYMTYDLHGTWDEESTWADNGCTAGDCLFSHVNMTETEWALAMLTKSGIATNQIMVGVASYGRSFEMSEEGCYTPSCTWTGAGRAGECTNTAGYISNAEINEILQTNENSQAYSDGNVTDFIVYNDTQWVGYMTNDTKTKRATWYEGYNFGGTAEWAIDLEEFVDNDESSSDSSDETATLTIDPEVWTQATPAVTCAPPCLMIMPPLPLNSHTTISFPPSSGHLTWSSLGTSTYTLRDGNVTMLPYYDNIYVPWVFNIDPVTTDYVNVWNQHISAGQTAVYQTSSVTPTPFAVVYTPTVGGSTTVIGGTTSVIPGFTYSSGSVTYTTSNFTGIWGGTTSVSGGTTQTPRISTVTPLAYPTTTNKTPDPTLNTKTTTVKSSSDSSSWGPKATSGSEHTGSICVINCLGGCLLCPPDLSIEISGGGDDDGGDDDDDDEDDEITITESAYTTTMTISGTLTTITESATTKTETESESATSTETTSTITVGIAVGTYTAFAEPSGSLGATTDPIASLTSLASLFAKEFSSLYSDAATATPSERFIIALAEDDNELGNPYTWQYFDPTYSASWSACDDVGGGSEAPSSGEGLPDGTFDISVDIHGMSDCVYTGTTDAAGTFTCPDLTSTVTCEKSPDTGTYTCYEALAPVEFTPKIQCSW